MPEKDYSGTPLYKKLGIKEGARVAFVRAPKGFVDTLGPLPDGVKVKKQARGPLDVIVVFAQRADELRTRFAKLKGEIDPAGRLWVGHPKKSSKIPSDLTFELAQQIGLDEGLVDNKSCAIDADWSGLQFVYRLKDRPGR
ncbi:MAG TPA: DUF3052 domain-containing protein [Actinomycetota bacterium]|jgi:hypothetical protein